MQSCGNKCKPFIMTMMMGHGANEKCHALIMYVCMLIKNAFKGPSRDLKAQRQQLPRAHISKVDYANGARATL